MAFIRTALTLCVLTVTAVPASADITAFIGTATSPNNRPLWGAAFGVGLLIVGFEFEYANVVEDVPTGSPSLRTGMGNVLLQTPGPIMGFQPYFTTGGGVYRELFGTVSNTDIGMNNGGGVKINVLGPLRVRLDYRVFTLRGSPRASPVHRLYAGANLNF
jgi:hypothetical protein